jgi:hypothetical protein
VARGTQCERFAAREAISSSAIIFLRDYRDGDESYNWRGYRADLPYEEKIKSRP